MKPRKTGKMDVKEEVLAGAEVGAEAFINQSSDAIVSALVDELKKVIPGSWDDALLESYKPGLMATAKVELLKLAEKISGQV